MRPTLKVVPFIPRSSAHDLRPNGTPLQKLYDEYERLELPRKAPSTQRNHAWTRKLTVGLGDFPSVAEVLEWRAWLDRSFAPSTAHMHCWNLERVYNWGAAAAKSSGNPVKLCEFKPPEKQPRAIRNVARAWPQILAAFEDDRGRAFAAVLRFCGVRKGEALALTRDDVIPDGRGYAVSFNKQRSAGNWEVFDLKGGRKSHRTIPARAELVPFLRRVLGMPDPIVRVGLGGGRKVQVPFLFPFRANDLERYRDELQRQLPLDFGQGDAWHVLRHSLAAELDDAGTDRAVTQKILGHASSATTDSYLTGLVGKRLGKEVWGMLPATRPKRTAAPRAATRGAAYPRTRSK